MAQLGPRLASRVPAEWTLRRGAKGRGGDATGGLRAGARTKSERTLAAWHGHPEGSEPYETALGRDLAVLAEQTMSGQR